ncbi:protein SMAX1-LIKE 3-like [Canna indica]|uniref:Protein SMAX1-LIKE 3-like n=1 Tax=Canna indica TaxID=4628 RepID=A0AAQ3JZ03_9LILI|nr:protein SMAX1-LIKE 3-like [Canna indica]
MRTGNYIVQHGLTPEAASIIEQAIALARRRGHAHVTPLHVANVMLISSAGLLRAACLRSHSHPLRCKALDLCLNVALNRLPSAAASCASALLVPPLAYHPHRARLPSLSNALVAAFKRAQATQRRGSPAKIPAQQQPLLLLALKIEVEHLVVSILDDPSVSRVMREAGFCSTQVKSNVEKAPDSDSTINSKPIKTKLSVQAKIDDDDDEAAVIKALASKERRSTLVIVGESLNAMDTTVRGVMERVENGQVPEVLIDAAFITLPLFSFKHMSREEVAEKIAELREVLMRISCWGRRGVMVYLGDLKWIAEEIKGRRPGLIIGPLAHVVMEIRSLLFDEIAGERSRVWLLGITTCQDYMSCKIGEPSLETLWALQPLTLPAVRLGLSLSCVSDPAENQLSQFASDADLSITSYATCHNKSSLTSSLPSWLQQHKEDNRRRTGDESDDQSEYCGVPEYPYMNWSSVLKNQHNSPQTMFNFSSVPSPCDSSTSSSSISSFDGSSLIKNLSENPNLKRSTQMHEGKYSSTSPYVTFNPNPNSTTSSSTMEMEYIPKFKELNAENLKVLCSALEKKVPWQQLIIPEIASTILQCRSEMMMKRKILEKPSSKPNFESKEATWLFFQGNDSEGKRRIAEELASLLFDSPSNIVWISIHNISSPMDFNSKKRLRTEVRDYHSYFKRLFAAINDNPHRVILIEDIEQLLDHQMRVGIKNAIERGRIKGGCGEEVSVSDAIIILSCKSFKSGSRFCRYPVKRKGKETHLSLDLNLSSSTCDVADDDGDDSFDDAGLEDLVDGVFLFN